MVAAAVWTMRVKVSCARRACLVGLRLGDAVGCGAVVFEVFALAALMLGIVKVFAKPAIVAVVIGVAVLGMVTSGRAVGC